MIGDVFVNLSMSPDRLLQKGFPFTWPVSAKGVRAVLRLIIFHMFLVRNRNRGWPTLVLRGAA
jgi:hypothetical protein